MMVFLYCLLAFALCYVLVPPVIALSWRIGAVDVPCDWRRMHPESIPRAGGLAIYLAFALTCLAWGDRSPYLMCTLGGGVLLLLVGLADDILCLSAGVKFFFQLSVAIACVLGCGIRDAENAFLAVLWVMTLTNAHNFVDGLDGLFSGCAAIEGGMLTLTFLVGGMLELAVPIIFLSLCCLAFRHYNRYPAQIFAGDCGSGTVGFLLGMLSLPLLTASSADPSALSPLLIFAYPLTDLFTAVLRRILRGKSPFLADRGHLHHRIYAAGVTHPQCTGVLLTISASVGIVGVLVRYQNFWLAASIASLAAAFLLIRIRQFIMDFA